MNEQVETKPVTDTGNSEASQTNISELNQSTTDLLADNLEKSDVGDKNIASVSNDTDSLTHISDSHSENSLILPDNTLPPESVIPDSIEPAMQMITAGGPIVWLLILVSIFSFSIILLKIWQFIRLRPEDTKNINLSLDYWLSGNSENAIDALKVTYPVQKIVYESMKGVSENRCPDLLQKDLTRRANALIHELRLYLRPLEIIASLSPLLGLMGTVVGMIIAFQQMEAAGNNVNPSVLSGGIWEALLTTAAGLAVAIPVAVMHGYFDRRVERVSHLINDVVTQVLASQQAISQESEISRAKNRYAA